MKRKRAAGVLLHPTSLPGPFGIGDLGKEAYVFADFLAAAGAKLWQLLPLGPTGYGNSPYAARSSFAGNELLISAQLLHEQGLLTAEELASHPQFPDGWVDFQQVEQWKMRILRLAANRFLTELDHKERSEERTAFKQFCTQHRHWLDDYALFISLCEAYQDSRWYEVWEEDIAFRKPEALERWQTEKQQDIQQRRVMQYFFFTQWQALRNYVNNLGIEIIGDIPIFVAADSADVWAHLQLFKTDHAGSFSAISGVPPDFFSSTGQLWGTPVYDWEENRKEHFAWWLQRIDAALLLSDIIRIDHFRGFAACWEVPAGEKTAERGQWVPAPGEELFSAIRQHRGELPIIAEDLGVVTPDVEKLRDSHNLPGMKVLQFAFDWVEPGKLDPTNAFLPHNYGHNCVAYTGTHDNDTTAGWYTKLPEGERDLVRRYLARGDEDIVWSMMRLLMRSAARYTVFPMQDLLELGGDCRMNKPATVGEENWTWRLLPGAADEQLAARFREMVELYGRGL
ncbi:MAG: 4-alpha-glucanotransferase [Spirochaetota bacterium]